MIPKKFIRQLIARPSGSGVNFSTTSRSITADIVKGPSLLRTSNRARPRPSLLQMPGLRSLPYWSQVVPGGGGGGAQLENRVAYGDPSIAAVVQHLDAHWAVILQEYNDVAAATSLPSDYQTDTEHHILHQGKWDWHSYMTKGQVLHQNPFQEKFPVTTSILNQLRHSGSDALFDNQLFEGTPFGYAFFSTLHNHSHIKAHSAPINFRLRIHLPLVVPTSTEEKKPNHPNRPACGIRVGNVVREWATGKSLVLDDSYEHEVWNDTDARRVLLLVDIWHPDVTPPERQEIIEMFQEAKEKGWIT